MRLITFSCVLMFGLVAGLLGSLAQTVPQSRGELRLTFAPIVKKVTPAVVNVYGARVEKARRSRTKRR